VIHRQPFAVYQNHARCYVLRILGCLSGERRGRDEDALGGALAVQRTKELLDLPTPDGITPVLRLDIDEVEA
jgi:hypothetical protein